MDPHRSRAGQNRGQAGSSRREDIFPECALELGALYGFLVQKGNARPALRQLAELGKKFESHLTSNASHREEQRHRRQERASRRLGTHVARTAAVHDAPALKGALRLSELVSPDLLLDRRSFRPKTS